VRSALEWAQVRLVADGVSEREFASAAGDQSEDGRAAGAERAAAALPAESERLSAGSAGAGAAAEEWPQIKAPRVAEILRSEYGFAGSERLVREYLRRLRPSRTRPAQRTGYRPGQVLQLDWAEMPTRPRLCGRERRVYALAERGCQIEGPQRGAGPSRGHTGPTARPRSAACYTKYEAAA
jgi:hypothetical protein